MTDQNIKNIQLSDVNDKTPDNSPYYFSLTPFEIKDDDNTNSYFRKLDFDMKDKKVYNIAIFGPYGSGKSSIIKSYITKRNLDDKTINISLGNYENTTNNSENSKTAYEQNMNRIERQIIFQLASQIPSRKIKRSTYAFINNRSKFEITIYLILIIMELIGLLSLIFNKIYNLIPYFQYKDISLFISIIIPVAYFVLQLLLQEKFHFNKISLQFANTTAELTQTLTNDETIIDRERKQIEYMIRNSGATIVVFEDLDRFNDIKIFNKLQEINLLVNNSLKSNKSSLQNYFNKIFKIENKRIHFIYMLRNDLFNQEDRTKYFNSFIEIVPVMNSYSSKYPLIDGIKKINNGLIKDIDHPSSKVFLSNISLYIDNYRLLKSIMNDLVIHLNIIKIKELDLDWKYLLSVLVLKNIAHAKFEELRRQKP